MKWLDSITDSMDMNLSKFQERVDRGTWHAAVHGVTKRYNLVTEQLQQDSPRIEGEDSNQ